MLGFTFQKKEACYDCCVSARKKHWPQNHHQHTRTLLWDSTCVPKSFSHLWTTGM